MSIADPVVMPLARELLACLDIEMQKVENPPKYIQLRMGSVVDHLISTTSDECCEGLAWVRPAAFYPSTSPFPEQLATPTQGMPAGAKVWAVTLEMGAVRCFPTPGPDSIPSAEQWDAATQACLDDAAAMRRALCCLIAGPNERNPRGSAKVLPGQWLPLQTLGGCAGGILTVTVMGPACDCTEAGATS